MTDPLRVSGVRLTPASPADQHSGLLGFVRCTLDGDLAVDGIGLRRTRSGRLTLSWPGHKTVTGRFHPHVRPISEAACAAIEAELLEHLFPLLAEVVG